ncbi:uncharacterized protein ACR2FA_009185 [Aphomia sociella]
MVDVDFYIVQEPFSYSDAESLISDPEGEDSNDGDTEKGEGGRSNDSNASRTRKRKRATTSQQSQPQSSKAYGSTLKMADDDVMATIVEDNITDPSRPVKRRIDELLLMCRAMMREKDHQINVLKEQVEELTKKNIRLGNALIDLTKRNSCDNQDLLQITEGTTTNIEQPINVQLEIERTIKIEREIDAEIVREDTTPLVIPPNSEPTNDDKIVIKSEIQIDEHDINDAANVTSVTEAIRDVDTSQIKQEIKIEEDRRDVDIGVETVAPDREEYDNITTQINTGNVIINIRRHSEESFVCGK